MGLLHETLIGCTFLQVVEEDHGKLRLILLTYSGAIFLFFISVDTFMLTVAYPSCYISTPISALPY
jgi:hypothetical protein